MTTESTMLELTDRLGLSLDDGLSLEQWQDIGKQYFAIGHALPWDVGEWANFGERRYGEHYTKAIQATGYKYKTLRNLAYVARQFELSRRRDNLPWSYHAELAGLEPDRQDEWLDRCTDEGLKLGELRAELRKQRLLEDRKRNPLPDGKYRTIYVDPPWRYGDERLGLDGYSGATEHYPTMTTDEICELCDDQGCKVIDLAHSDAVLFMWATAPLLPEALRVIDAWSFTYKQELIWDKVRGDFGHYVVPHCEHLLIATRGSCLPEPKPLQRQLVQIERTKIHSQKPKAFYEIIENMYPDGPRLELFARTTRPGWVSWGNEVALSTE